MSWHDAVRVRDVRKGSRKHVTIEGRELSLIHTDEGVFCVDFRCPHTGGPLGEGLVEDGSITCPLHKWRFDLRDGTHTRSKNCPPAGVYALRLNGDVIQVEL